MICLLLSSGLHWLNDWRCGAAIERMLIMQCSYNNNNNSNTTNNNKNHFHCWFKEKRITSAKATLSTKGHTKINSCRKERETFSCVTSLLHLEAEWRRDMVRQRSGVDEWIRKEVRQEKRNEGFYTHNHWALILHLFPTFLPSLWDGWGTEGEDEGQVHLPVFPVNLFPFKFLFLFENINPNG